MLQGFKKLKRNMSKAYHNKCELYKYTMNTYENTNALIYSNAHIMKH